MFRKGAAIVAMCIEGKQISSEELAQFLADRAGSGAGDVAFVIGSSHGLADEVKRAAALKFSMGRITMPHQLARLVLTEQIYRACTINAGMKYHKVKWKRAASAVLFHFRRRKKNMVQYGTMHSGSGESCPKQHTRHGKPAADGKGCHQQRNRAKRPLI